MHYSIALLLGVIIPCLAAPYTSVTPVYTLNQTYAGNSFFDNWNYYVSDPTIGCCSTGGSFTVGKGMSMRNNLTYTMNNSVAILKPENVSELHESQNRESVHLFSMDPIPKGALILYDLVHIPFGDVITAYITSSYHPDLGLNDGPFSLTFNASNDYVSEIGHPNAAACRGYKGSTSMVDGIENFLAEGGGVFAIEFTDYLTSFWYFNRTEAASIMTNNVPDTSKWKDPFSSVGQCRMNVSSDPVYLSLDIRLCQRDTSDNVKSCYQSLIDPRSVDTGYFAFNSIQVYQTLDNISDPSGNQMRPIFNKNHAATLTEMSQSSSIWTMASLLGMAVVMIGLL